MSGVRARPSACKGRLRIGLLASAAVLLLGAGSPESAQPIAGASVPWLDVSSPDPDLRVGGSVPLIEVRGRAGLGGRAPIDVVIVFDLSESAFLPSGMDVNRDGHVGRLHPHGVRTAFGTPRPTPRWTTDPGDTIVAAEREAARRLLRRLEAAHARVGLAGFAGRGHEIAPVGDVSSALRALDRMRTQHHASGTNLGSGVRTALYLLQRSAREHGPGRRQVMIVLSDGQPTVPAPAIHARSHALAAAQWAREAGVPIYGYALGATPEAARVLEEMSLRSGGSFVHVQRVGEVVDHLPYADLGGIVAVEMTNRTTQAEGRAVRLFGDGSFDGFVPLAPGENLLEVRVRSSEGAQVRTLRAVHFDAESGDLRADRSLQRRLRRRSVETELAARARAARTEPRREVQIEVDSERGLR